MEGYDDEVYIWDHLIIMNFRTLPILWFCFWFQDAMPLALQSMMELQEISCNKNKEERSHSEALSNAPNPCGDFVSYLYSQIN